MFLSVREKWVKCVVRSFTALNTSVILLHSFHLSLVIYGTYSLLGNEETLYWYIFHTFIFDFVVIFCICDNCTGEELSEIPLF